MAEMIKLTVDVKVTLHQWF